MRISLEEFPNRSWGATLIRMQCGQVSITLERDARSSEARSTSAHYVGRPKPSGLGMVSTPNISATVGGKSLWGDMQARRNVYGDATKNGLC
jgi:hypothetical protein